MNNYSLGLVIVRFIAEGEAKAGHFEAIAPEHLWMALTKICDLSNDMITGLLDASQDEKAALIVEIEVLRKWFVTQKMDTIRLRRKLRASLGKGKGTQDRLHRSPESVKLFEAAAKLAEANHEPVIHLLHLNQAILEHPPPKLAELLIEAGYGERNQGFSKNLVSQQSAQQQSILDVLGRDLTALARQGALDLLIGRKEELRQLAQILMQRRKGNVILVGDAGVGKTCIVEGLAQRIVAPDCTPAFQGKRIIELSMATLLSGTMFRGEFEARLEAVIREAETDPKIILFMDEFHTIMGSGNGSLDAANILKPALARGKMHLIGATTTHYYERSLAKDEAIARRFEVIWIEEPSREEAIEILCGAQADLEGHHGLQIRSEAIAAAVEFSIRYMPDRRLPDKALDLLDQACARKALQSLSIKTKGSRAVYAVKEEAGMVGREEIAQIVARRYRIPYDLLVTTDQDRLNALEHFLTRRIIGQQKVIQQIRDALQTAYTLKDSHRPITSFLFAGPTGVGKTETAKVLAEFLFGSVDSLIRIDLSEYMEKHQIARLLGAPPGYIGYEESGMLTSALRQRPAAVVLFDEIEKAHPDVLNVLLQILDEGQLTDGQGRKASFTEAVVILTTNLTLEDGIKRPLGFNVTGERSSGREADRQRFIDGLRKYLRPELLGRIKQLILFEPLTLEAMVAIAEKILNELWERLQKEVGKVIEIPEELRKRVVEKASAQRFGAREIQQWVEAEITAWVKQHG